MVKVNQYKNIYMKLYIFNNSQTESDFLFYIDSFGVLNYGIFIR